MTYNPETILQIQNRIKDRNDPIHVEFNPLTIREISNGILAIDNGFTLEALAAQNKEWMDQDGELDQVVACFEALDFLRRTISS